MAFLEECNITIKGYYQPVFGACIITTPYFRPDGDHDEGSTLDYLELSGINPFSPARKALLESIVKNHGILLDDNELMVPVNPGEDFGSCVQRLLDAMQHVQHLVFTATERPARIFKEEVQQYLSDNHIQYEMDFVLTGFIREQRFDFVVRLDKPRAIKALSATRPSHARHLAIETLYAFEDVRRARTPFVGISVINDVDQEGVWEGEPLKILQSYSDALVRWSKRQELLRLLVA